MSQTNFKSSILLLLITLSFSACANKNVTASSNQIYLASADNCPTCHIDISALR